MIVYFADSQFSEHLPANRLDYNEDTALYKLDWILKRAQELGATIVCGGDFFEFARPSYSFLNKIMAVLLKYKVPMYSVLGNHDIVQMQAESENAAMFALFKSGLVKQLSKEPFIDEESKLYVTASDFTKDVPSEFYFSKDVPAGFKKVLVIHNSLIDVAPKNSKGEDLFNCVTLENFKTDANLVLCGHIHKHWKERIRNTTFISPGPICRLSIKERDIEPRIYILGNGTIKTELLPLLNPGEFVISPKEIMQENLKGEITNTQIEANQIEIEIGNCTYEQPVKEHGLLRIDAAREKASKM